MHDLWKKLKERQEKSDEEVSKLNVKMHESCKGTLFKS